MNTALKYDITAELLSVLQRERYDLGVGEYLQIQTLLQKLPDTMGAEDIKHAIIPLIAKTKVEQDRLYGLFDEIVKNIRLLIQNHFFVRLRINYTDKNIENASKIAEDFMDISEEIKNDYLYFDYHRVWQDHKLDDTSDKLDDNLNNIREKGFKAAGGYSPNNVKDSCYADKRNSAVINYNGDIYKCTARDFTKENRAGYISEKGELIWENDYLERRMNAKFNNKPCLSCRIMPLCNGGCSQHAMEKLGEDYCVYMGDEQEKSKVVRTTIQEILNNVE